MSKRNQDSWLEALYNIKVSWILLIVVIIIFFVPLLYIIPAKLDLFDFSTTGTVGDTIGGITSPFLNGLAALLVFIAFKAQIEANKLVTNQTEYNIINDHINRIEDDKLNINELFNKFNLNYDTENNYGQNSMKEYRFILNKLMYITTQFELCLNLIHKFDGDKKSLEMRIYNIYSILFEYNLAFIKVNLEELIKKHDKNEFQIYEVDLSGKIYHLSSEMNDIKKTIVYSNL